MLNYVNYWDNYYSNKLSDNPSDFAVFCSEYLSKGKNLLDVGCGDGRDSIYFNNLDILVTGVDKSSVVINKLKTQYNNINFFNCDFNDIPDNTNYDYIYSRWFLHAINQNEQSVFLHKVNSLLNASGLIFLECRSVNDSIYGIGVNVGKDAFIDSHYRRFIRIDELRDEIINIGFDICFCEESDSYSIVGNDNPSLIRIIASKSKI